MTQKADLLIAAIPALRGFGYSLVHDMDRADDLVQETLVKAWKNWNLFEAGTNVNAWLFTILRNQFYSDLRKTKREVSDDDGKYAGSLASMPSQEATVDLKRLDIALGKLPPDQREALTLVIVQGMTYDEAGEVTGSPSGTMKSRVSRARDRLAKLLGTEEFGSDAEHLAAYGQATRLIA